MTNERPVRLSNSFLKRLNKATETRLQGFLDGLEAVKVFDLYETMIKKHLAAEGVSNGYKQDDSVWGGFTMSKSDGKILSIIRLKGFEEGSHKFQVFVGYYGNIHHPQKVQYELLLPYNQTEETIKKLVVVIYNEMCRINAELKRGIKVRELERIVEKEGENEQ